MNFNKLFYYVILSLIFHGVLLLSFGVSRNLKNIGMKNADYTKAYLFEDKKWVRDEWGQAVQAKQQAAVSDSHIVPAQTAGFDSEFLNKTSALNSSTIQKASGVTAKGQDELVVLLHNAIQKHQQYPQRAAWLKQTGSVMVGLCVKPDGRLTDIVLKHSSGYSLLDEAALQAAAESSPLELGNVAGRGCFKVPVQFIL